MSRNRQGSNDLKRRDYLHTIGIAGVSSPLLAAIGRAKASSSLSNVLTIEGTGSRTTYTVTTTGDINASTDNGASINPDDDQRRTTASGYVVGGRDSYAFSGEIAALRTWGEGRVYLNDQEINPANYLNKVMTIEGTGSRAEYVLTANKALEKTTATGGSMNSSDDLSGRTARGYVVGGRDSYALSWRINRLSIYGNARVYLDGRQVDPNQFPNQVLTIDGAGSHAEYDFAVDGRVEKSTANGASINSDDQVSTSNAQGYVNAGSDSYVFSGNFTQFTLDRGARVVLDRSERTLSIEGAGAGQGVTYAFSVSDSVDPINHNPDRDTVYANGAEGFVSTGSDTYRYSGDLSLIILGETTASIDGAVPHTNTPPTIGVYSGLSDADFDTIGRMEEWQGTPYLVQNLFVAWNPDSGYMDWLFNQILPRIWNAGRVPLITWEPYTPGAQTASVDPRALVENQEYTAYLESLDDTTPDDIEVRIENGEYDQYIDQWARRLREFLAGPDGTFGTADDRRAYVRLAHEMNGDWYPWSPTVGSSAPESYIKMWRRVYNRFEQQDISTNAIQWMWCVNADDVGSYTAEQLYPGDTYVDWLGIDGYNWGQSQSWSQWESPDSIYGPMLDRIRKLANKSVCVAEFASSSETNSGYDPQRKGEWIRDTYSYFNTSDIDMWCWFNEDKETDWAVFDGVRGTETVTYNGQQVDAYTAYREIVSKYASAESATVSGPMTTVQFVGND